MYTPGRSKELIRNSVFNYFKDCTHILTLPNLYFGLEEMFLKQGKKVDCSEYVVNTFEGQRQIAPKGLRLFNLNIKDMDLSVYDGLFLDLYGTFNKSMAEALPRIKVGSKVAITFLMARENRQLQQRIDITNREQSYVRLLAEYGIEIDLYANYCDTTPMCVFYGTKIV